MPSNAKPKKKTAKPRSPSPTVLDPRVVPGEAAERQRMEDEELVKATEGKQRGAKMNALKMKTWMVDATRGQHAEAEARGAGRDRNISQPPIEKSKAPAKKKKKVSPKPKKAKTRARSGDDAAASANSDSGEDDSGLASEAEKRSSSALSPSSSDDEEPEVDDNGGFPLTQASSFARPRFVDKQSKEQPEELSERNHGHDSQAVAKARVVSTKATSAKPASRADSQPRSSPDLTPPPSTQVPKTLTRPALIFGSDIEEFSDPPERKCARSKTSKGKKPAARKAEPVPSDINITDDEEEIPQPKKRKTTEKKVSQKSAKKFAAEKPVFKSKKNQAMSNEDSENDEDSSDSKPTKGASSALLRSTKMPNRLGLKKQSPAIADVLHESFELAQRDIVFVSAWPEGISVLRLSYGRKLLIEACKMEKLVKRYGAGHMDLIEGSIKEDEEFMKPLSRSVLGRLPSKRYDIKVEAKGQIARYQLNLGQVCIERLESLLQKDQFHFPGTWGGESGNVWQPTTSEGFMHPAVLKTLKVACFSKPATSLGYKHVNSFTSSILDKPHKKEMPKPMLALALSAVFAALKDYSTGEDKPLQFSASSYFEVYQRFAKLLDNVQVKQPIRFHDRMHQIYLFCAADAAAAMSAPSDDDIIPAVDVFDYV